MNRQNYGMLPYFRDYCVNKTRIDYSKHPVLLCSWQVLKQSIMYLIFTMCSILHRVKNISQLWGKKTRVIGTILTTAQSPESSGVPQGSTLPPLLFNVMMRDLPTEEGVATSEYADNITIYAVGDSVVEVTNRVQSLINKIQVWTKRWGLELNNGKTKGMIFTRKRVQPVPLLILNVTNEYV